MYKRILLSILLFASLGRIDAQGINDKAFFGIKGGVNFPRLYFRDTNLQSLPHNFLVYPTASLYAEFKLYNRLSLGAEFNCQLRGGATTYTYETDYTVNYKIRARYISMRLPVYYYLFNHPTIAPYFFIGPDFGYAYNGDIFLTQPGLPISDVSVSISDSNINRFNFGMLAGVGVRKNANLNNWTIVLKVDFALNWGHLNSFSPAETNETATPTNVHAYNSQGKRLITGLELNLTIGISKTGSSNTRHSSTKNSGSSRRSKGLGNSRHSSSDCYPWN